MFLAEAMAMIVVQINGFITRRVGASGRPPARSAVSRDQQFPGASTGGRLADRIRNVMKPR